MSILYSHQLKKLQALGNSTNRLIKLNIITKLQIERCVNSYPAGIILTIRYIKILHMLVIGELRIPHMGRCEEFVAGFYAGGREMMMAL